MLIGDNAMNKKVLEFYEGLGLNIIDIIQKGKSNPWRLQTPQIEYAMDVVMQEIKEERRQEITYHGQVPKRIFTAAKEVKAKQYVMITDIIGTLQAEIDKLKFHRILIGTIGIYIIDLVILYGVFK